jgi:hypothetical protein
MISTPIAVKAHPTDVPDFDCMKLFLFVTALVVAPGLFAQNDTLIYRELRTYLFEREDGAAIHYIPPETAGDTWHFGIFPPHGYDYCPYGPDIDAKPDAGKTTATSNTFSYKVKGVVILTLKMEADRITVTYKNPPAPNEDCPVASGVYILQKGLY